MKNMSASFSLIPSIVTPNNTSDTTDVGCCSGDGGGGTSATVKSELVQLLCNSNHHNSVKPFAPSSSLPASNSGGLFAWRHNNLQNRSSHTVAPVPKVHQQQPKLKMNSSCAQQQSMHNSGTGVVSVMRKGERINTRVAPEIKVEHSPVNLFCSKGSNSPNVGLSSGSAIGQRVLINHDSQMQSSPRMFSPVPATAQYVLSGDHCGSGSSALTGHPPPPLVTAGGGAKCGDQVMGNCVDMDYTLSPSEGNVNVMGGEGGLFSGGQPDTASSDSHSNTLFDEQFDFDLASYS